MLGINDDPVTIKSIEVTIIDRAFDEGWVTPRAADARTGKRVAVVGSGPAGLAAADQLNHAGHLGDRLRARRPHRRSAAIRHSRVQDGEAVPRPPPRHHAGGRRDVPDQRATSASTSPVDDLRRDFDALVLAGGATAAARSAGARPRARGHPLRDGVPAAAEQAQRRRRASPTREFITAKDKHVIIIGGGDTGADCLGTAHRQGARSVHQLELLPRPPDARADDNPWPLWPNIFRVSSAHEEGGERLYAVSTERFTGDGNGRVTTLHGVNVEHRVRTAGSTFKPVPGTDFTLDADLVLLAMGFLGPERGGHARAARRPDDRARQRLARRDWMTSVPGVFTAGDMQRGQSLIVWAIAEGRSAARGVDQFLMGSSDLPAPLP